MMSGSSVIALTSEIGRLKRVILHRPGPEIFKVITVSPQDHPVLPSDIIREPAIEQFDAMVRALKAEGMEVLFAQDLLDDAIENARTEGTFVAWLRDHLPPATSSPELLARASQITAADLVGATDELFYHRDPAGDLRPLVAPMKWMYYAHDFAVMTPRGVIISNFLQAARAYESVLARFMFDRARAIQAYPIAFDAIQEQVYLMGADVLVADADTLLIGTGNQTERAAARKLARALHMDVVEVRLPSRQRFARGHIDDEWTGLHLLFFNLDTIFSFVDTDKGLALPYFLEAKYASCDPLTRILGGLQGEPGAQAARLRAVMDHLQHVGWVTRYKAGSGDIDPCMKGMKLVDYLRDRGYQIIYAGGEQGTLDEFKYVMERVLREVRFQAANVLSIAPGKVLAFEENGHTLAALRAAGVETVTFPGSELVRWNGGPHCMVQSLERTP
ncbi:arginine deiminase family protein [Sorangium sp. So ce1128]